MEWKDIKGYEGIYQINSSGEVRSLGRYINNNGAKVWREGKSISINKIASGYWTFNANKDNKKKTMYLHKCLAEAFIDNPKNLTEVNHKDHDKDNNKLENLEWVTHEENMEKYSNFYMDSIGKSRRYCSKCNTRISYGATLCNPCNGKVRSSPNRPSRSQLLEDRAVMSLDKMSIKYSVSRATISRWLKKPY